MSLSYWGDDGRNYLLSNFPTTMSGHGFSISAAVPATVVNEKLKSLGYEISGPDKTREPVRFSGLTDTLTFTDQGVTVEMSLANIQYKLRNADGDFDLYELETEPVSRKWGWK